MIDHLSPVTLAAIADGELPPDQLNSANEHLASCPACASQALSQSLLKAATAKAGHRFSPPPGLQDRFAKLAKQEGAAVTPGRRSALSPDKARFFSYGWLAACAVIILCFSLLMVQRSENRKEIAAVENRALAMEASDQHIAALASSAPPQVISTDRHTVKPWFQGKLPFSFNLPDNLPAGTNLLGANLAYVHDQAAAQLLYSIGNHRASIYLKQRGDAASAQSVNIEQTGFHVILFSTGEISGIAVSDVDPSHLSDLVSRIVQAQTK